MYSNSATGSQYSDDRSPETRLDLVVRDDARDRSSSKSHFHQNYREDSLTPTTETEHNSAPSSFILQETSSYCLSHGLPKPIPKFSGFGENGSNARPEQNGYSKYNGFESKMRPEYQNHQFSNQNGMQSEMVMVDRHRSSAELHRAHLVNQSLNFKF